jgi:membrane protease YdiL (CAAX protease family)
MGSLAVVFLAEGWCQWLEWHPENYPRLLSVTPTLFASALAIGLIEELIFRGFLQTLFEQDYSPWGAALLASTIFALLHLVWGEAETMPQLPGLWLMGIVLTVARWVAGGGLGLAWGLHAGWLWGLWCLDGAKAFSYTGKGASWLTGLNGQPLAGLAGVTCMLGTGMVLWGIAGLSH